VPAAFFLSGRALSGLGAYWFQDLEALLLAHGEQRSAAMLRAPDRPEGLMLACERNGDLRRRVSELAAEMSPDVLQRDGIAALVAANMTVGFHTLNHDTLPDLDDRMLEDAVSRGVEELAAITGTSLKYFAYPHGKGDTRSAAAVERAGARSEQAVDWAVTAGATDLGLEHTLANDRVVAAARAAGLSLGVWTVNDSTTIKRMLDLGVDIVTSHRPDLAKRLQRGQA